MFMWWKQWQKLCLIDTHGCFSYWYLVIAKQYLPSIMTIIIMTSIYLCVLSARRLVRRGHSQDSWTALIRKLSHGLECHVQQQRMERCGNSSKVSFAWVLAGHWYSGDEKLSFCKIWIGHSSFFPCLSGFTPTHKHSHFYPLDPFLHATSRRVSGVQLCGP